MEEKKHETIKRYFSPTPICGGAVRSGSVTGLTNICAELLAPRHDNRLLVRDVGFYFGIASWIWGTVFICPWVKRE